MYVYIFIEGRFGFLSISPDRLDIIIALWSNRFGMSPLMIRGWPPPPPPRRVWSPPPLAPCVMRGSGRPAPPLWCGVGGVGGACVQGRVSKSVARTSKPKALEMFRHSQEDRTLFEDGSKMSNYVSTAPARADRRSTRTPLAHRNILPTH